MPDPSTTPSIHAPTDPARDTAQQRWLSDHTGAAPWPARWPALLLLLVAGTPLALAATLTPSTQGIGTHTQLGLDPCSFEQATGLPCATCGMTTTFALATHARPIDAFLNQPAGFLLALAAALAAVVAGWSLVTGMRLSPLGQTLARPPVWLTAAGLLMMSWLYKIALHTQAGPFT